MQLLLGVFCFLAKAIECTAKIAIKEPVGTDSGLGSIRVQVGPGTPKIQRFRV